MFWNPDPFAQFFPRIAPSDLILRVHFVPKDFKVDKPSGSFNTNTKAVGESEQPLSPTTAWKTNRPGPSITIPLSSPEHTPSA